jgi:DNA-binding transcriptional ArsR family regulator
MRRDPFQSIADPNRRKIIDILFRQGVLTMNQLAAQFDISRPAVSKHTKILDKSGVITVKQVSVERYVYLNFDSLEEILNWVLQYKSGWEKEDIPKQVKKTPKKKAKAVNKSTAKKPVNKTKPSKAELDEKEQLKLF